MDSVLVVQPSGNLQSISVYTVAISNGIKSIHNSLLQQNISFNIVTAIDSSDKFARISDSVLLDLVQKQTLKYFWDFGHPVSGLARERNTSGDVVTTGGSGFGIMSLLVGVHHNFISRTDGLGRMTKIVSFLTNKAHRYHGAFPHWLNGATGETVPFSPKDDGADLVETSYLMEGLLCARQFFNSTVDNNEIQLRDSINNLWNGVEWSWFRQNNQNALYWHWSPDFDWAMNMQINGWNEALITYVLAASSNNYNIPLAVYQNGWALNGNIKNNKQYFGITLPLGPDYGGPLFFSHYSFLGINPNNLMDVYANYWTQNTAHSKINYSYCVNNPKRFNGYSSQCWGLTASDDNNGYDAHSPTNDDGVISPTAALSSMAYTPTESMNALRFFYYKLGDKIWGDYGFKDAFNLSNVWFADSYLAIDQGPIIVMIENYRSGLLWNLFMSCPEVKKGMKDLGFQSPDLQ
ncbi:beta-glucosidase [Ferruginibacter albus]|nr:beta-glucosidase [Ferruginibacter albus]